MLHETVPLVTFRFPYNCCWSPHSIHYISFECDSGNPIILTVSVPFPIVTLTSATAIPFQPIPCLFKISTPLFSPHTTTYLYAQRQATKFGIINWNGYVIYSRIRYTFNINSMRIGSLLRCGMPANRVLGIGRLSIRIDVECGAWCARERRTQTRDILETCVRPTHICLSIPIQFSHMFAVLLLLCATWNRQNVWSRQCGDEIREYPCAHTAHTAVYVVSKLFAWTWV